MSKHKQDKEREAWKRRKAKRQRQAESQRATTRPGAAPSASLALPDRRAMEKQLQALAGGDRSLIPHKAQQLLWQAFECDDPERRCQLAQQALAIFPDCADAYVLLAENAGSRREALDLYREGVAAGERALGAEAFEEYAGHFWGHLETRPYMRARAGLAQALWATGQRDEAVGHLQEMLRLNPNDNQGLRYRLASCYLGLDRHADLQQLLDRYPDEGSAAWAYCRALLAFRTEGDTPMSQDLLRTAVAKNRHVPAYLLESKAPPQGLPDYYSPGRESEAIVVSVELLGVWKSTPGAVDWLRAQTQPGQHQAGAGKSALPSSQKRKLLAIPRRDMTWQVDFRPTPNPVQDAGRNVLGRVVLTVEPNSGFVLGAEVIDKVLTAELLWKSLTKCLEAPSVGAPPHRPARLQVRPSALWESLRPRLQELDIELSFTDALDELDSMWEEMRAGFPDDGNPGLLDTARLEPAKVGAVFAAAADYYRAAPWKRLHYESALEVSCATLRGGPWYAVIMGQAGLTFGLSLYDDLSLLQQTFAGHVGDREIGRRTAATTLVFGSEGEIPFADLEAALRHGWPIAGRDAYPWVFRKEANRDPQPPAAWQIELLELALRAIPGFVSRRSQTDTTREELPVATCGGEVRVGLRWVAG